MILVFKGPRKSGKTTLIRTIGQLVDQPQLMTFCATHSDPSEPIEFDPDNSMFPYGSAVWMDLDFMGEFAKERWYEYAKVLDDLGCIVLVEVRNPKWKKPLEGEVKVFDLAHDLQRKGWNKSFTLP